jgi:hypothetical protein
MCIEDKPKQSAQQHMFVPYLLRGVRLNITLQLCWIAVCHTAALTPSIRSLISEFDYYFNKLAEFFTDSHSLFRRFL